MPLKKPKNFLPLPPPFNQQSSAQPSSLKRPGISQMGGGQRQVLVVEGLMTEEQVGSAQKGLGLELGGLRAEGEGPAPLAGEAHQEVDGTCSGLNTAVAPLKAEHSARKALSISDTHNRQTTDKPDHGVQMEDRERKIESSRLGSLLVQLT